MKRIYTSNIQRYGQYENSIAICCVMMSWTNDALFMGQHWPSLGPTWEMVKQAKAGNYNRQQFADDYIDLIKQRYGTAQNVVDRIPDQSILLCYEPPYQYCHRHTLARWLNTNAYDSCVIEEILTEQDIEQQQKQTKKGQILSDLIDF